MKMQTKSIVQASANVIRIVNLKKGDVYKRFEASNYGSDKIWFGVVKDVHNDGEKTFIEAVEYEYSYSSMYTKLKVFSGEDDVSFFPATLEEIKDEFSDCERRTISEIEDKEKELIELKAALETTQKLVSGELQKELQTPEYKEYSQQEYNEKKQLASAP